MTCTPPTGSRPAAGAQVLVAGAQVTTHQDAEATVRYAGVGDLQVEEQSHLVLFGPASTLPAGASPVKLLA